MIYLRLFLTALFLLPGTILHEISHAVAAMLTGARIDRFSLIPRLQKDKTGHVIGFVYGSVDAAPRIAVLHFFVALAPLSLWGLLYLLLLSEGVLDRYGFHLEPYFSERGLLLAYASLQLLIAGKPSVQDLRVALRSIVSPSGLVLVAGCCFYLWVHRPV